MVMMSQFRHWRNIWRSRNLPDMPFLSIKVQVSWNSVNLDIRSGSSFSIHSLPNPRMQNILKAKSNAKFGKNSRLRIMQRDGKKLEVLCSFILKEQWFQTEEEDYKMQYGCHYVILRSSDNDRNQLRSASTNPKKNYPKTPQIKPCKTSLYINQNSLTK